jgi:hypothetical protein
MLTWIFERLFFAESPLLWFLGLVIVTQVIYHYFFKQRMPSIQSASIVMGLGAVCVFILPFFNTPLWMMTLFALELMILWLYFAVNYMQAYAQDDLKFPLQSDQWVLGVWVIATAMTGLLLEEADPLLYGCIIMLALISLVCVGWYLYGLRRSLFCFAFQWGKPVNGTVMLPGIALLSVLLLAIDLFHDDMAWWIDDVVILLALWLIGVGLARIASFWFLKRSRYLMLSWRASFSLIYGAFALLGLALVYAGTFSNALISGLWCVVAALFCAMTYVEGVRAYYRVKLLGWMRALTVYHASAWYRIFAWVMVYELTFEVWHQTSVLSLLLQALSNYGYIFVLLFAIVQLMLALRAQFQWPK